MLDKKSVLVLCFVAWGVFSGCKRQSNVPHNRSLLDASSVDLVLPVALNNADVGTLTQGVDAGLTQSAERSLVRPIRWRGREVTQYDAHLESVDVIGYELDLRVDESSPGAETFTATNRITLVATSRINSVFLHAVGLETNAVSLGSTTLSHRTGAGGLRIALGREFAPGDDFTLEIRYRGRLRQGDQLNRRNIQALEGWMVFHRTRAQSPVYLSLNWPENARQWIPSRDHPSDAAMMAVRATFPENYTVLSNGHRDSVTQNNDHTRTWQYVSYTPMPTYDLHLAAYEHWVEHQWPASGSVPRVLSYAYPSDAVNARRVIGSIPAALAFFQREFGTYRWDFVSFLEEPIFSGAMEHPTVVSMDDTLYPEPSIGRRVAFHELAHHWSGNLVRVDRWNDLWLSEGFADYLTARVITQLDGPAASERIWLSYFNRALGYEMRRRSQGPHALAPRGDEVRPFSILDSVTYNKGAWILRMLEHRLGTEAFTRYLHHWFDRYAFQAVRTEDFERHLTQESGEDLTDFFRDFVYQNYHPEITVHWEYSPSTHTVDLRVEQIQPIGPALGFRFPLEVRFIRQGQGQVHHTTVQVTTRNTQISVPVPFEPAQVMVDPDHWLFATVVCDTTIRCPHGLRCRPPRAVQMENLCLP